jgi:hypothetical protein
MRLWFDRCNHEMLRDCESEAVVGAIEQMLRRTLERRTVVRRT